MDFDCFMNVDEFQITQHELQGEFMRKFYEFMRKFNTNILCLCCVILTDTQNIFSKMGGVFFMMKVLCERKPSSSLIVQHVNHTFFASPWSALEQVSTDILSHYTVEKTLEYCGKSLFYNFDFFELNNDRESEFMLYTDIRAFTKNSNRNKWSVKEHKNCIVYINRGQMKISLNLEKTDFCTVDDIMRGNYIVVTETLNTYRGNKGILQVTSSIPSVENTTSTSIFSKIHAMYRII